MHLHYSLISDEVIERELFGVPAVDQSLITLIDRLCVITNRESRNTGLRFQQMRGPEDFLIPMAVLDDHSGIRSYYNVAMMKAGFVYQKLVRQPAYIQKDSPIGISVLLNIRSGLFATAGAAEEYTLDLAQRLHWIFGMGYVMSDDVPGLWTTSPQ